MKTNISFYTLILALFLTLVTGCGKQKPNGPIVLWEGTVTVAGKPLPTNLKEAYIQVRPVGENMGQASPTQCEIVNGKYRLEQVPRGDVVVTFILTESLGSTYKDKTGHEFEKTHSLVPKSVNTGISMTATEDNLQQNFDL